MFAPPYCSQRAVFASPPSVFLLIEWLKSAVYVKTPDICSRFPWYCRGRAPVYVSDMLTPAADVTSRAMRSSTNCDYFVRRTTLRLGDRAFSVATPRAWNRLPSELKTTTCSIETFKRRLNLFLFNTAFSVNTS